MTPFRRDPFTDLFYEMARFQEQFERMFGIGNLLRQTAAGVVPLANVWQDDNTVYVEMDLPGIQLEKLDITVKEGNILTVQGEREPTNSDGAVWHRQERLVGPFTRVLTLPVLVDPDKVEASLEQGVLRLKLSKSEAAKPRKIAVRAG
jgi:HSP20 family protein